MELTVYQDTLVFDDLKTEWNDVLGRAPINHIFYTLEWHSTWWNAYQAGELLVLTCRNDDGKLVGIAPLYITNEDGKRIVRFIGGLEVTDYSDFIIDRQYIDAVYEVFAQYLADHRELYDVIQLCNIPEKSATYSQFAEILQRHGVTVETAVHEVCPIIVLPDDWEGYMALLDKKQRHEVRRKMRRMQGVQEKIDWYIVDGQSLANEIGCFMELMAESDPEKRQFLQDEKHVTFFQNIVPLAHRMGWMQMSFLTVGDERVAGYFNFVYNNRVLVYNSGLNAEGYGQLSPGIVLLAYNIQHAIEQGYYEYDFLRGDEIYKYRMGGQDSKVYSITTQ